MRKALRLVALVLALAIMLAVAGGATLLAYWGATTPTFVSCTTSGRPSTHQSATYPRSSDGSSYTFTMDNSVKGFNLRMQVKTRPLFPMNLGGPSGSVMLTLHDPSGAVRWQESISAKAFDVARAFDAMPGQWQLRLALFNHSGGYDICLAPAR